MSNVERIRAAVNRTIDAVNDLLPAAQALEANDDFVLVGPDASLDSMGFVNFIVALEEELEREFERGLNIADLLDMQTDSGDPISTVADLIRVLSKRLG
jgi:acyl carrier protein